MSNYLRIRHMSVDDDIQMILANQIQHLVPLSLQFYDHNYTYEYCLKGYQSLSTIAEDFCLTKEHIVSLFESLIGVFKECDHFLLESSRLCILPKYIYYDKDKSSWFFIYLPGGSLGIEKSVLQLLNYLLKWIDYGQEEVVKKIYQMHQDFVKNQEDCITILSRYEEIKKPKMTELKMTKPMQLEWEQSQSSTLTDHKSIQKSLIDKDKIIGLCMIIFLILVGFIGHQIFNISSIKIGACLLLGVVSVLSYFLLGKKIQKKSIKSEENLIDWESPHTMYLDMTQISKYEWNLVHLKSGVHTSLTNGQTTIGRRGQGANITIDDKGISSFHCAFYVQDQHIEIKDLGSKNGTYVNGIKLLENPTHLKSGDVIQLGYQEYKVIQKELDGK